MSAIIPATLPLLVKVCAYCEHKHGRQRLNPGEQASHGVCKRHFLENVAGIATAEYILRVEGQPNSYFCPDLAEHPELVETPKWCLEHGTWNQKITTQDEHGGVYPTI